MYYHGLTAQKIRHPMSQFAFVTTCKGRLHHLQQTLPLIVADAPDEVVVVDYGCPQRSGDWVEANFPQVTVVRVTDDPGFHLARARNAGAAACTASWICFIDADVRIRPGFVAWMRGNARERRFYRQAPVDGKRDPEAHGTAVCPHRAFKAIEGYDELFTGWGGEDDDLYDRLLSAGLSMHHYPAAMVDPISHGDTERLAFHALKRKDLQHIINMFYRTAKMQVMALRGIRTELPLPARRELQRMVESAVMQWGGDAGKPFPSIRLSLKDADWLPPPYRLLTKAELTLTMDLAQEP